MALANRAGETTTTSDGELHLVSTARTPKDNSESRRRAARGLDGTKCLSRRTETPDRCSSCDHRP